MKYLLIVLVSLFLGSCDAHYPDHRQFLVKEYRSLEVLNIPGQTEQWLIRTPSGEIWYATTGGGNFNHIRITNRTLMFKKDSTEFIPEPETKTLQGNTSK